MGSKIAARATDGSGRRAGRAGRDARRSVRRGDLPRRSSASASRCWSRRRPAAAARACASCATPARSPTPIQAARREAIAAFGDGTLYVERLIERPRHVEVQVFADDHGSVVHLFERECSVQRRHQKVIEESPSPALTPALRARMRRRGGRRGARRRLSQRRHDRVPARRRPATTARFYFLEMNTRLQVEHPVTEAVTGVDLVRAQLLVAVGRAAAVDAGGADASAATRSRRASTPRIRRSGFLPQAGPLLLYREPRVPGIRVDSGVGEGDEVPVHYDPLLAKVIATAETRDARDRAARRPRCARSRSSASAPTSRSCSRILEHPRVSRRRRSTPASSTAKARRSPTRRRRRRRRFVRARRCVAAGQRSHRAGHGRSRERATLDRIGRVARR